MMEWLCWAQHEESSIQKLHFHVSCGYQILQSQQYQKAGDGWAGKCTTAADSKRMSQSWRRLCWTRGQTHCTVSTAGRKREVWFSGSVGRAWAHGWHREGLLSTGEPPHQTEQNPLQSVKQVSGLCYNRGEENNWHLLEFSPHLLLAKNVPYKTLTASYQSQGKQFGLISYRVTADLWAERCCRHPFVQTPLEPELPLTLSHRLHKEKLLCTSALCPSDS